MFTGLLSAKMDTGFEELRKLVTGHMSRVQEPVRVHCPRQSCPNEHTDAFLYAQPQRC